MRTDSQRQERKTEKLYREIKNTWNSGVIWQGGILELLIFTALYNKLSSELQILVNDNKNSREYLYST